MGTPRPTPRCWACLLLLGTGCVEDAYRAWLGRHDGGAGAPDAAMADAGPASDAGSSDGGAVDAGGADAGRVDAGAFDAGYFDAGCPAVFAPQGLVPLPLPPTGMATMTFVGATLPGVVISSSVADGGNVMLVSNLGSTPWLAVTGTFQLPEPNQAIATGDLDGDGLIDFVTLPPSGVPANFQAALQNVGGGFTLLGTFPLPLGHPAQVLALVEVQGPGVRDVFTTDFTGSTLGQYSHQPTFPYYNGSTTPAIGGQPWGVSGAQLFHPPSWDVAVALRTTGQIQVLTNGGGSLTGSLLFDAGVSPLAIASGQLDGTGGTDLAVANSLGGDVSVLFNTGPSLAPEVRQPVGSNPFAIATGHFRPGPADDIVVATAEGLVLLVNDGRGGFPGRQSLPFPEASELVVVDVDGDGKLDLVAFTNGSSPSLQVFRNVCGP